MNIKLFTRDGGFVTDAVIPRFDPPPEVILWGNRMFIAPHVDAAVRALEVNAGILAYIEASLAYAIPGEVRP